MVHRIDSDFGSVRDPFFILAGMHILAFAFIEGIYTLYSFKTSNKSASVQIK